MKKDGLKMIGIELGGPARNPKSAKLFAILKRKNWRTGGKINWQ